MATTQNVYMDFSGSVPFCSPVVSNRRDYKQIAQISRAGNVTWYRPPEQIPPEAISKVQEIADENRERFIAWARSEIDHRPAAMYSRMMATIPANEANDLRARYDYIHDCTGFCNVALATYINFV